MDRLWHAGQIEPRFRPIPTGTSGQRVLCHLLIRLEHILVATLWGQVAI